MSCTNKVKKIKSKGNLYFEQSIFSRSNYQAFIFVFFRNFTYFYNYVFGNCYVFNERNVKTNVTAPGSENGKLFIKAAMSQDT